MGIKLLDKRIILLLIILLFANVVFAINPTEDVTIPAGEISKDDLILAQAQQQVLATSNVSTTVNQMAVQQKNNLETAISILLQNQNDNRTTLIITIIIVTLASQGIWWAIYLYFQTKGMLPAIKPPKPKQQKNSKKPIDLQKVFE